jgi:hypothetical protein
MFVHLSPILEKKQGSKGQQPLGGVWGVPTFPFFFSVRGGEDGNFRKALIF